MTEIIRETAFRSQTKDGRAIGNDFDMVRIVIECSRSEWENIKPTLAKHTIEN